jgi:hypothetical protein
MSALLSLFRHINHSRVSKETSQHQTTLNFETSTCIFGRNKEQLNSLLSGDTIGYNVEIEYWFSDSKANVPTADARMSNTYAAAGSEDATSMT